MSKTEFKLLQFEPAQKRQARNKFITDLINSVKKLFNRKKGYEKYRFVSWTYYTDLGKTSVSYQNIKTGVCKEYIFPIKGSLDWETVDLWLRSKK